MICIIRVICVLDYSSKGISFYLPPPPFGVLLLPGGGEFKYSALYLRNLCIKSSSKEEENVDSTSLLMTSTYTELFYCCNVIPISPTTTSLESVSSTRRERFFSAFSGICNNTPAPPSISRFTPVKPSSSPKLLLTLPVFN